MVSPILRTTLLPLALTSRRWTRPRCWRRAVICSQKKSKRRRSGREFQSSRTGRSPDRFTATLKLVRRFRLIYTRRLPPSWPTSIASERKTRCAIVERARGLKLPRHLTGIPLAKLRLRMCMSQVGIPPTSNHLLRETCDEHTAVAPTSLAPLSIVDRMREYVLPFGAISVIFVMLIPLPAFALDLLLALSMAASIIVFLSGTDSPRG